MSDDDIYRTYNSKISNISQKSREMNRNIREKIKSSNFTQKDAELLEKFLKDYKEATEKARNGKRLDTTIRKQGIELTFGKSVFENLPFLNFKESGLSFEKEFEQLMNKNANEAFLEKGKRKNIKTPGSEEANTSFNLKISIDEDIKDIIDSLEKEFGKKLKVSELEKNDKYYTVSISTKLGGKPQKVDSYFKGFEFKISGTENDEVKKIINILTTGKFSLKSYLSDSPFSFGKTTSIKALIGMCSYFNGDSALIRYYNELINKKNNNKQNKEIMKDYQKWLAIYEIAGYGLSINNIDMNVDFIILNRAQKGDIKVYSVNYLVKRIMDGNFNALNDLRKIKID